MHAVCACVTECVVFVCVRNTSDVCQGIRLDASALVVDDLLNLSLDCR